jgi:hypothetical protein
MMSLLVLVRGVALRNANAVTTGNTSDDDQAWPKLVVRRKKMKLENIRIGM